MLCCESKYLHAHHTAVDSFFRNAYHNLGKPVTLHNLLRDRIHHSCFSATEMNFVRSTKNGRNCRYYKKRGVFPWNSTVFFFSFIASHYTNNRFLPTNSHSIEIAFYWILIVERKHSNLTSIYLFHESCLKNSKQRNENLPVSNSQKQFVDCTCESWTKSRRIPNMDLNHIEMESNVSKWSRSTAQT